MSKLPVTVLEHPEYAGLQVLKDIDLPDLVRAAISEFGIKKVDRDVAAVIADETKFEKLARLTTIIAGHPKGTVVAQSLFGEIGSELPPYLFPIFHQASRENVLRLTDKEYAWLCRNIRNGKEIRLDDDLIRSLIAQESFTPDELSLWKLGKEDLMFTRNGAPMIEGIKAIAADPVAFAWAKKLVTQHGANPIGIFCNQKRFIECANNPAVVSKIESLPGRIISSNTNASPYFGSNGGIFATKKDVPYFVVEKIIADPELEKVFDKLAQTTSHTIIDSSDDLVEIWSDTGAALWLQDLDTRDILGKSPFFSAYEVMLGGRDGSFIAIANHEQAKKFAEELIRHPEFHRDERAIDNIFCNSTAIIKLLDAGFSPADLIKYLAKNEKATIQTFARNEFANELEVFLNPPEVKPAPPISAKPLATVLSTLAREFAARPLEPAVAAG